MALCFTSSGTATWAPAEAKGFQSYTRDAEVQGLGLESVSDSVPPERCGAASLRKNQHSIARFAVGLAPHARDVPSLSTPPAIIAGLKISFCSLTLTPITS